MIRENIVLSIWILKIKNIYSRTLRECVDWNMFVSFPVPLVIRSHSSWVRGLKHDIIRFVYCWASSHSSWVRGLKLSLRIRSWLSLPSHSSWVRGLKHLLTNILNLVTLGRTLRECVDWNILFAILCCYIDWSHSSWVRGLKRAIPYKYMHDGKRRTLRECVDWNTFERLTITRFILSHSSWVRGLKPFTRRAYQGRTPVALFVSAWIETFRNGRQEYETCCRTLRECVDWNLPVLVYLLQHTVSHSSWVRGLKRGKLPIEPEK